MYMLQSIEKSRHKQIERKAREDRRRALSAQTGASLEELEAREAEQAALRTGGDHLEAEEDAPSDSASSVAQDEAKPALPEVEDTTEPTPTTNKASPKEDVFDFDDDDDDLF